MSLSEERLPRASIWKKARTKRHGVTLVSRAVVETFRAGLPPPQRWSAPMIHHMMQGMPA